MTWRKCVAALCDNTSSTKGASMHNNWPRQPHEQQANAWLNFVQTKGPNWKPSNGCTLCSAHFLHSFQNYMPCTLGLSEKLLLRPDIIPTIHTHAHQSLSLGPARPAFTRPLLTATLTCSTPTTTTTTTPATPAM